MTELDKLRDRLRDFAAERDWDQFHSPKNLAMALSAEAGELVETFQWLTEAQSFAVMDDPASAQGVRDELADIMLYALRLADILGIDLESALRAKMAKNAQR